MPGTALHSASPIVLCCLSSATLVVSTCTASPHTWSRPRPAASPHLSLLDAVLCVELCASGCGASVTR
eukprot:774132-Rhodomonas_salina.1